MSITRAHSAPFAPQRVCLALALTAFGCGSDPVPVCEPSPFDPLPGVVLLDDAEDGDNVTPVSDCGLVGYWYVYDDKLECSNTNPTAGVTMPVPQPRGRDPFTATAYDLLPPAPVEGNQYENQYGLRFWGGGHTSIAEGGFGAGLGVGFNVSERLEPYDLTAPGFVGLRFLAFSAVGPQALHVKLKDVWSEPAGNKCIPRDRETCSDEGCNDDPEVVVQLTLEWQEFALPFTAFERPGASNLYFEPPPSPRFDPMQAYQLQFMVDPVESFDVWIDNVGFMLENSDKG